MDSDEEYSGLQIKEGGTLIEKSPRQKRAAFTDKADAALLSDDDSLHEEAEELVLGYTDSYHATGDLIANNDYEEGGDTAASDDEISGHADEDIEYTHTYSKERETSLVDDDNAEEHPPAIPIATDMEISKIVTALNDVQLNEKPTPGRLVRVNDSKKNKKKRKEKKHHKPKPLIHLDDSKRYQSDSEVDHNVDEHDGLEWDDQYTISKRREINRSDSESSDEDSNIDHSSRTTSEPAINPGQGLQLEELYVAPIKGTPLIQLDGDNNSSNESYNSKKKFRHKVYADDPDIHQAIMELATMLHRYKEDVQNGVYRQRNQQERNRHKGHMHSLPDVNSSPHNGNPHTIRNAVSLHNFGPYNGHGKPGKTIISRIMHESQSSSSEEEEMYRNSLGSTRSSQPGYQTRTLGPSVYDRCPDCGERHPPDDEDHVAVEDLEICPDCGVPHNPYQHPPSPTSKNKWNDFLDKAQKTMFPVASSVYKPISQDQDERRHDNAPSLEGPHRREELIVGALYKMKYLGSSQVITHHPVTKETRMQQAQEAYSRIKVPDGEQQPVTNIDLVISTERIKVINTDDKQRDVMMDHALRTVCFICDMGNILVLMATRLTSDQAADINLERNFSASLTSMVAEKEKKTSKSMCHVFECEQAQLVAQAIGQAFNIAYDEFLKTNGIRHDTVEEAEYCHVLESQKIIGKDLPLLADDNNAKDVVVQKKRGEALGIMLMESGWGSMLPTVFVAHLANYGPAARLAGQLAVGDHVLACNGASLVGLPLAECNQILKNTRSSTRVILNVVSCPPVVEVLIVRPDTKYQLGFSVKNGTICSLLRGGIAERGGVRVGHRIIEVNGESMVAKSHQHIVDILANTTGEIQLKTMPVAMYRLMVGLDMPQHV